MTDQIRKTYGVNAVRNGIFAAIDEEREYQNERWGLTFDRQNTANDWIKYICDYATQAAPCSEPFDLGVFQSKMRKVAGLAIAALERATEDGTIAPRHYDSHKGYPIIREQPKQGVEPGYANEEPDWNLQRGRIGTEGEISYD